MAQRNGHSRKTISTIVREVVSQWMKDGTIGSGAPKRRSKPAKKAAVAPPSKTAPKRAANAARKK